MGLTNNAGPAAAGAGTAAWAALRYFAPPPEPSASPAGRWRASLGATSDEAIASLGRTCGAGRSRGCPPPAAWPAAWPVPPLAALLVLFAAVAVLGLLLYPTIAARRSRYPEAVEEDLSAEGGSSAADAINLVRDPPALSVIVPAYNEEDRLPKMLDEAMEYLGDHHEAVLRQCRPALRGVGGAFSDSIEILVVSDGSTDGTADVVRSYAGRAAGIGGGGRSGGGCGCACALRLVTLRQNGGKGAAVRAGLARRRGGLALMADADGATEFGDGLTRLLAEMGSLARKDGRGGHRGRGEGGSGNAKGGEEGRVICAVFGSRAHMEEEATATRSAVRTFLMRAFHFFVGMFCTSGISDTQCGFKLFTADAAAVLAENLHLRRWAFDTEIVVIMERNGWRISEVPVNWHEVGGSKIEGSRMALAMNSAGMLRDMICVRLCYSLGLWKVSMPPPSDSS